MAWYLGCNFTLTLFSSVSMTTLTTPPRFVKGHKRHSSTDMTPSRGKASYKQCSQDDSCVTRLSGMYEWEKQKKLSAITQGSKLRPCHSKGDLSRSKSKMSYRHEVVELALFYLAI